MTDFGETIIYTKKMTVYIELVLIENLCMNYILLFTTGKINKCNTKMVRLLLASLIGSVYAVFTAGLVTQFILSFLLKLLLSVSMVYVSFAPKKIKTLLKELVIFYFITFAFGGIVLALLYLINPQNVQMKNGMLIGFYPIQIITIGAFLGFLVTQAAFHMVKVHLQKKEVFCEVEIGLEGKKVLVTAILDTGNTLKEPITGNAVVVIESEKLRALLPESILDHTEDIINGKIESIEMLHKLKVIPFTSLGRQNGLLLGFTPDYMHIKFEDMEYKNRSAIVGITNMQLTKTNAYAGLVNADLIYG